MGISQLVADGYFACPVPYLLLLTLKHRGQNDLQSSIAMPCGTECMLKSQPGLYTGFVCGGDSNLRQYVPKTISEVMICSVFKPYFVVPLLCKVVLFWQNLYIYRDMK